MGRNYSQKELRLLYTLSGNICAFPDCNEALVHPGESDDDAVNISDIAHIVADSRQGPRGRIDMTDDERNQHKNLILLCPKHHRIIDAQPRTFSVPVLRQMKAQHEARVATLAGHTDRKPDVLVDEVLHSTMLPVTFLPSRVFSAPCKYPNDPKQVSEKIIYPQGDRNQVFAFTLRDSQLYSFQDLRRRDNAYCEVINPLQAVDISTEELVKTSDGQRRLTELLNRALRRYAGRFGITYDKDHHRYYYRVYVLGEERSVRYRPLNAKETTRKVAWPPRKKATGEARPYWWHLAAGLRWEQAAGNQWFLAIRPERHLTRDGQSPFPPEKIGPRVTRLKARMYNDKYLSEVQFWRDILCVGEPRFIINFGDQSLICDSTLVTYKLNWPGVPDDGKSFKNQQYDEDLFTLANLKLAISGHAKDEDDGFDEESE